MIKKYPMTQEEVIEQATTQFGIQEVERKKREAELDKTKDTRLKNAIKNALYSWKEEELERKEERKQGLITSMDEFIEAIRQGTTDFQYTGSGYRKRDNKFGAKFLEKVILPMLKSNSDFEIDGIKYGIENSDHHEEVEYDTGEREFRTGYSDDKDLYPIYGKRMETVSSSIRVGKVAHKEIRYISR